MHWLKLRYPLKVQQEIQKRVCAWNGEILEVRANCEKNIASHDITSAGGTSANKKP